MNMRKNITTPKRPWKRLGGLLGGAGALLLWGCSTSQDIQEVTYVDGLPTSTAVVRATPNGYQTISGDPVVAVNGDLESESMLPYGGGEQGIRRMEDESPY